MKRIGISVLALALWVGVVEAQPRKKQASAKTPRSANARRPGNETVSGRMEQTSAQSAFGSSSGRLVIADPFVTLYNGRAAGTIPLTGTVRPIPNIPKLRYGVANSRILFYNTTSPTTGGITGSGTVGTGSSVGNVGTSGAATGVNGKNPYAGPGIYGNRVRYSGQPVNLPPQREKGDDQNP
ncbi:MAG: hypothetical protein EOO15_01655 [Chitinophagaceae bacterium]|nr:MAG: hypothetical protein EOO15_01655 [Chitinophagaceae bacterium]